jgi:Protein of unknown function (DUF2442)
MLKKVIQVRPNSDFTVHVYFNDGKIKLYDMKPFLIRGVFLKISDINDFLNKCTVMNGTLAWDLSGKFDPNQCIDMDPESIYLNSSDVLIDPLEQESA